MSSYANLALLLGSIGRPGRVFGRQGGHQSAYMYDFDWPHPQDGDDRAQPLAGARRRAPSTCLIFADLQPAAHAAADHAAAGSSSSGCRSSSTSTSARRTSRTIADVVLPAAAWGEYTYTRENLERRLRVNQKFYDPPGEVRAEYLIFVRIAQRLASRHELRRRRRVAVLHLGGRLQRACARPLRARRSASTTSRPKELRRAGHQRHPAADQARGQQADRHRADLHRQVRHQGRQGPLRRHATQPGPTPTRWPSCPRPIKPNAQYPFFVTTVRYQTIWQSGYTYRCLTDLAAPQRALHGVRREPRGREEGRAEGRRLGRAPQPVLALPGRGERLRRGAARADLGHLRLAGPQRQQPVRRCRSTTPTTWSPAAPLQQKSNGAFFKNTAPCASSTGRRSRPRTRRGSP